MLTQLHIKNFTIVKSLSLDLEPALSVLTGETGAGKSIIVDAVTLALGGRTDTTVIRSGEDYCDITLCFDITYIPTALEWLEKQGFVSGTECLIRRIISQDGRSRSTVNGHPCPQNLIRELAGLVLTIHDQHQHQTLLKRDIQQQLVDTFAHNEKYLLKIQHYHDQWRTVTAELDALSQQTHDRHQQLDLLHYQLTELTALNLQEQEWETLTYQHKQLHHAKALIHHITQAMDLAIESDKPSASMLLQQAIDQIHQIHIEDKKIIAIKDLLNTSFIYLQEAGDELNDYRNHLNLSPESLELIEQRLSAIHDLARKHHANPTDLLEVKKSLLQHMQAFENIDTTLETLRHSQAKILADYRAVAKELSNRRMNAAKQLEKYTTEKIQLLGMNGSEFKIEFEHTDEIVTSYGNEKISFLVSTNIGQGFLPLQKVVSGGELSRISLAIQAISAQQEETPTIIFDEVDAGIGGKTAEIVGQLLKELGKKAQVICITHLPQVAVQGTHQFTVEKTTVNNSVYATIRKLELKERVEEIARMLSGSKITEQTLAHAEELLENL